MTEEQVEALVERRIDALDRVFLTSAMTEDQYKADLAEIDRWAERARRGSKYTG